MKDPRGESENYYRKVIDKMKDKFEPITDSEDYDIFLEIDGDGREGEIQRNFHTGYKCDRCKHLDYHESRRKGNFSYHFCILGCWNNYEESQIDIMTSCCPDFKEKE